MYCVAKCISLLGDIYPCKLAWQFMYVVCIIYITNKAVWVEYHDIGYVYMANTTNYLLALIICCFGSSITVVLLVTNVRI